MTQFTLHRRRNPFGHALGAAGLVAMLVMLGAGLSLHPLTSRDRTPAVVPPASLLVASAPLVVCARRKLLDCVLDGDTIRVDGATIRLADIDAPEVFSPKCASEKALGDRATQRLVALINAGPFALEATDRDLDRYGRELRVVSRNRQSLGAILVAEGLARAWDGRRHPWCG